MFEATVMIAAWNAASAVRRSVESAQKQADVAIEVVVVDDASTDDTQEVAAAAGAIVHRLETNCGPSAARNRAIECANGRWLAVLDSDDTMESHRLRRMIDLGTRLEADVVLGNFRRYDEADRPIDDEPYFCGGEFEAPFVVTMERFVEGNIGAKDGRTLGYLKPLISKHFLDRTGLRYNTQLRNGEDCHLVFACLAEGAKTVFSPAADYRYTVRKGSISYRTDPAHIRALVAEDDRFVSDYSACLSQESKRLFERRRRALLRLNASEDVLRALSQLHLRTACGVLLQKPEAIPRVLRQLFEATQKRVRKRY